MDILPAIDLRGGKVVRLMQGDYTRQKTYSPDPAEVARQFVAAGAKWIHVVDLDAARSGKCVNGESVRSICRAVEAKIELGGGARDEQSIDAMLGMGVSRVVVGSAAMKDWPWFERLILRHNDLAGMIALGLDARDGMLAVHGWTEQLETAAVEVAARIKGWPLCAIVATDISRDGMLEGVNIEAIAEIIAATDVPVIASGGVSSLADVRACKRIGCAGAIVGRAWYEGKIDLAQACKIADEDEDTAEA
ncbi:MAG: 1-(5-phosphoribosyl)-5-[(5-phosphoribosylamino)methylideneamino]imidazole-4-carboxamide isomerase [Planctomycetota bacterium]|nr:1-(5-phosphoribosyl)-5-[(5-phosphoribosylamino)methylideneamino]imidazole-4-carboxamide isomerase [Planctomycetota bacterium]